MSKQGEAKESTQDELLESGKRSAASVVRMSDEKKSSPPADEATSPWIGRVLDERYKITAPLGEGGMGTVFVAEHLTLKKEVALKVIQPSHDQNSEFIARFAREAMVTAKIENPHVTTALDYGTLDDGAAYLVMQLVRGKTLRNYLSKKRPFPNAVVAHLGAQIADALEAAHRAGVVHRDLKPENIVLQRTDYDTLFVKILDFGLAQTTNSESMAPDAPSPTKKALTKVGTVMGTPGYMAPEQALGERVDHRADLYALGVLLWEMSTGKHLFYHEKPSKAVSMQLSTLPEPLRTAMPKSDIPEAFEGLVTKLLYRDPEERPATAAEVRDELRSLAGVGNKLLTSSADGGLNEEALEATVQARSDIASAPTLLSNHPESLTPSAQQAATLVPTSVSSPGNVDSASYQQMSSPHVTSISQTSAGMRWSLALLTGLVLLLVGALASAGGFIYWQMQKAEEERSAQLSADEQEALAEAEAEAKIVEAVASKLRTLAISDEKEERMAAAQGLLVHQPADEVPPFALGIAELEQASNCRDMIDALNQIERMADFRALPALFWYRGRPRNGCGAGRKKDCYGCIRTPIKETIDKLRDARIAHSTGQAVPAAEAEAAAKPSRRPSAAAAVGAKPAETASAPEAAADTEAAAEAGEVIAPETTEEAAEKPAEAPAEGEAPAAAAPETPVEAPVPAEKPTAADAGEAAKTDEAA